MVSKQGSILGGCVDILTIKFNWNLDLNENKKLNRSYRDTTYRNIVQYSFFKEDR